MHTLFAFPFSCSFAVKLELARHDLPFEVRTVQRGPATRSEDAELHALNPKRKVPVLCTPDGETLTEIVSILDHLDRTHGPDRTALERRRVLEDLAFIATELHQAILGPLFDPDAPDVTKADVVERLLPPLAVILAERAASIEADDSPAGSYLLWGLLLLQFGAREAVQDPALMAFVGRQLERPGVADLLQAERRALRG